MGPTVSAKLRRALAGDSSVIFFFGVTSLNGSKTNADPNDFMHCERRAGECSTFDLIRVSADLIIYGSIYCMGVHF